MTIQPVPFTREWFADYRLRCARQGLCVFEHGERIELGIMEVGG